MVKRIDRRSSQAIPGDRLALTARHELSSLDVGQFAKHLSLRLPSDHELKRLVSKAKENIPGLADIEVVRRVLSHNPDCVWAIARKCDGSSLAPEGLAAMLPLTDIGLSCLVADEFNGSEPKLAWISRPNERPAGIYIWALFAPGRLAGGFVLFTDLLKRPPYGGVDLYTRTVTPAGLRFTKSLGFTQGAMVDGNYAPHLFIYPRSPASVNPVLHSNAPLYDSYPTRESDNSISVTVARSLNDLMRVISIRSAVYIAEQEAPFGEEYDGNDFSAMHLIGYVGDEPAGCLRIRYFADFAKLERLAVLKKFRRERLAFLLVRAGIELCRKKGYRKLYGHAQKRLVNFWSRFGFRVLDGSREFVFADFDYVEMIAAIDEHPEAIRIGDDPYVIIRPEGRWHLAGVLEHSSRRPVTRPSISS